MTVRENEELIEKASTGVSHSTGVAYSIDGLVLIGYVVCILF